jgi:hypothetical protein
MARLDSTPFLAKDTAHRRPREAGLGSPALWIGGLAQQPIAAHIQPRPATTAAYCETRVVGPRRHSQQVALSLRKATLKSLERAS